MSFFGAAQPVVLGRGEGTHLDVLVFAPREVPHKLTNVSAGPSTHLGIVSPAGFERFFEEVRRLPRPPAVEQVMELAAKYRLDILAR